MKYVDIQSPIVDFLNFIKSWFLTAEIYKDVGKSFKLSPNIIPKAQG